MDALTKSSADNLLEKIRHLASRPVPEFNRFEALDLLEALKNAAQDTKHDKAGYFRLAFETLVGELMNPTTSFVIVSFLCLVIRTRRGVRGGGEGWEE